MEALRQQLESDIAVLTENFEQLKLAQSKFADSLAALGALGGAEPRSILVPMTSSLYVPGTLVPGVPVLVDVGTSFIVGKTPAAAAETFSKKIAALKASTEQIVKLVNEKKRDAGELEAISAQLNSQLARLAPPQQA